MRDAAFRDYNCVLLEDCTGATDRRNHDAAIAMVQMQGGVFGAVSSSYAAQTSGDRNVGVVGLAIFSERGAVWTPAELQRRDTANPFPSRGYAMPPR